MYQSFTTKSGAAVVASVAAKFGVQSGPDGLEVDFSEFVFPLTVAMPQRLYDFLIGLRLLRNIPLSYLVPDAALLPTEAIRFFHLDPTWMDRVVDGVFSVANTGTLDMVYSAGMLASIRLTLDNGLEALAQQIESTSTWKVADGMTGMLIRSELVRRWPNIVVRAYGGEDEAAKPVAVLRAKTLSKDVLVVVFAGMPTLVELREPYVGIRFGVEIDESKGPKAYVLRRDTTGFNTGPDIQLNITGPRVVPARSIVLALKADDAREADDARMVAIQLMRPPYVQRFGNAIHETDVKGGPVVNVPESWGSEDPPPSRPMPGGRFMNVASLQSRIAQNLAPGKS